jgi:hypothetical protein
VEEFTGRIARHARFPAADFGHALETAVNLTCDYAVHPVATLARFSVSDRPGENRAVDIRRRAHYFVHFPYLIESLERFLESDAGAGGVDRGTLMSHLGRFDVDAAQDLSPEDWTRLFEPLVASASFAFQQEKCVPLDQVVAFLKDKKADRLADAVRASHDEADALISPGHLGEAIRRTLQPPPSPQPESAPVHTSDRPEAPQDMPLWKKFAREDQPKTSDVLGHSTGAKSAEPLWKAYQRSDEPDRSGATDGPERLEAPPSTFRPPPAREPETHSSLQPESPPSQQHAASLEDRVLGADAAERDRFIRELFQGNETRYAAVLQRLADAADWPAATAVLSDEVFRPFQVDIYSAPAIAFTNAVERHIRQRM